MTTGREPGDLPDEPLEDLAELADEAVPPEASETSRLNLRLYLAEIAGTPPLGPGEEEALARGARAGDAAERARLVEGGLRRVVQVARRYLHRGIALPDLIEEGNVGLLQAVERYDPDHDGAFATFAVWWVRHAVVAALAERAREQRQAVGLDVLRGRLAAEASRLAESLGRVATVEELASAAGIPVEQVERLRALEPVPAPARADVETIAQLLGERPELAGVLDDLAATERDVLRLRAGIGGPAESLEVVAMRLGMSPTRAGAAEAAAVRKVAALLRARGIEI